MPLILNPPPPTSVEPVTDFLHGVAITDPYRWLEDQDSPRTRNGLAEQASYTPTSLDAIPGRARTRKTAEDLLAIEVASEPRKVANRYFYLKRAPYQQQPVIMMREGDSSEEIVLVDPAERAGGNATSVRIMNVSRNGNVLAYGVTNAADSFRAVEFLDVASKQLLPDHLPRSFNPQLLFSPDGRGMYYSYEGVDAARPHYRAVYWHEFGMKQQEDPEIFFAGESPEIHLSLRGSIDGRLLAYVVTHANDPMTFDVYIQDGFCRKPARKILQQMEWVFHPFFVGDQLIALTDWRAPNLRVVAIDLDRPGRDHWVDLVAESQYRIKDFAFVNDLIYVVYVKNASTEIEILDRTGRWHGVLPCPTRGTARFLWHAPKDATLLYEFSSFHHPPTIFSYDTSSGKQKVWGTNSVNLDPSSFHVEQIHYKSKDGTEIPMFLVAQKGQRMSGPLPTFLGAYGGFGVSRTPQFNAYSTFLIEHGFLFAFANVRGGGEFGAEWHRAAKRHNRQTAFDDFIAAAEWLIAQGYTAAGKLAIGGGSNAGLLMGAALTQRPDLFRAVVCMGPLLDMLRYHRFDFAHLFADEFGTADREDDFVHLRAYSPYHRVEKGALYPAVMFISGDEDTCCNPMHARKMTARLQGATSSDHPILLDYKRKWGHAPVQPLNLRIDALTDRLAFICHELAVSI